MNKKMIGIAMFLSLVLAPAAWANEDVYDHHKGSHAKKTCQFGGHGMKAMDSNKDGQVTLEEFMAGSEKKAKERFAKKDKNGDGVLSKADRQMSAKKVDKMFERHDLNKDGLLSKEEMLGQKK
ncbi:MAG: EF-hand domain-containing protein [Mariprofundaceae bacterium]|nr:EF-hand domain-containing protein [Mariprofundaceae bacterium]